MGSSHHQRKRSTDGVPYITINLVVRAEGGNESSKFVEWLVDAMTMCRTQTQTMMVPPPVAVGATHHIQRTKLAVLGGRGG